MSDRHDGLPIIRIDIEGMRHSICAMLRERQIQMDEHVKESLTRYVEGGEMAAHIDRCVRSAIESAITTEADNYFRYGDGRKFIAECVAARLNQEGAQ